MVNTGFLKMGVPDSVLEERRLISQFPRRDDGRPYATDRLLEERPVLRDFVHRTCNSWCRDELQMCYVLRYVPEWV